MEQRESYHSRRAEIVFISGGINQLAATALDAMLPLELKSCLAVELTGQEMRARAVHIHENTSRLLYAHSHSMDILGNL